MNLYQGSQWAGTEEALAVAHAAMVKAEAFMAANPNFDDDDYEGGHAGLEVKDGVAIIGIKGPMLNADIPDFIADMFGLTTYPSLQRRFTAAMDSREVNSVVLDVNSGGGQVSGLYETYEILQRLNAAKPVQTYAGDVMASAAYWLGSTAQSITMSPMGCAGSIGVIAVHISERESYEREGYKPTVMRAGSRKHLGHSLEDFSDEAKAEMQRSLDFAHQHFIQAVADNRNINHALIEAGIGDGRVFYGQEAVDVGLADKLGSFAEVLETAERNSRPQQFKPSGFATAKTGELEMNLEEALAKVEELQGELANRDTALAAAEVRATEAEAAKAVAEASNTALATSLAEAQAANAEFATVLEANIQAKATALGTKVLMPDTLEGKQKMNAQLEEDFQKAFPSGAVSASAAQDVNPNNSADVLPAWFKRVAR